MQVEELEEPDTVAVVEVAVLLKVRQLYLLMHIQLLLVQVVLDEYTIMEVCQERQALLLAYWLLVVEGGMDFLDLTQAEVLVVVQLIQVEELDQALSLVQDFSQQVQVAVLEIMVG